METNLDWVIPFNKNDELDNRLTQSSKLKKRIINLLAWHIVYIGVVLIKGFFPLQLYFDKRSPPLLQNKLQRNVWTSKKVGKVWQVLQNISLTKYNYHTLRHLDALIFFSNQWNHSRGMSNVLILVQHGTKHIKLNKPIYQTSLHVLKVYNRQENWKLFLTFIWRGLFNFKVLGNIRAEAPSSGTLAFSKNPIT